MSRSDLSRFRFLWLAAPLFLIFLAFLAPKAFAVEAPEINATGAIVLDADTGDVYYEKNADLPRPIASMTKIMGVYMAFEAIDEGRLTLDQGIPASKRAADISKNRKYSGGEYLTEGAEYPLDTLLRLVMTASCNGSMIAIAEYLGDGSEAAFVERMNQKTAEWGIDAHFADCCGFEDNGNAVSPRAMGYIARRIIQDYPQILTYSSLTSTTFNDRVFTSTNKILTDGSLPGIDGLKTGYTYGAGFCFTGTAKQDGIRIIAVVMNSTSTTKRMTEGQALLEYGFSRCRELAELTQNADRDFQLNISPEGELLPYSETTFTASISGYDSTETVPCQTLWSVNGEPIEQTRDGIRPWNDAAFSASISIPYSEDPIVITASVLFPGGEQVESSVTLPVSQAPILLSAALSSPPAILATADSMDVSCTLSSNLDRTLAIPAGWYLDGEPIPDHQFERLRVTSDQESVITLKGSDLALGEHTLSFRCNPSALPGLEPVETTATFMVLERPSDWAVQEVGDAIAQGLVPESIRNGYPDSITRENAAHIFMRLLETASGKSVDDYLADYMLLISPNAFTDCQDPDVLSAHALGILRGVGDGRFAPEETLTRAQAAAIVNRVATHLGIQTWGFSHSFVDVEGHWVNDELGWPSYASILVGVGDGRFLPDDPLTNEQTIAIALRAYRFITGSQEAA